MYARAYIHKKYPSNFDFHLFSLCVRMSSLTAIYTSSPPTSTTTTTSTTSTSTSTTSTTTTTVPLGEGSLEALKDALPIFRENLNKQLSQLLTQPTEVEEEEEGEGEEED